MKEILAIILGISFIAFMIFISVVESERTECKKWLEYQGMYEGFYTESWQKDQCEKYDIFFDK